MGLSYELISQFAKLATGSKKTSTESTVYGTIKVDEHGNKYVKLDGSDQLTPLADDEQPSVDSSSANANEGERVSVLIKNHTATVTGNISSPAARTGDVEKIEDDVQEIKEFDILIGEQIQADKAYFKKLLADDATLGKLEASEVSIIELIAKSADIDKLITDKISVTDLIATKIDADVVVADKALVENLKTANADILSLIAEKAIIDKLIADKTDLRSLMAEEAYLKYANIDFANISEAAIKKIFAESGIIKELSTGDAIITGELVGVTISGDLIKANTLMAEKLVVRGSDGNYYKLNTDFSALDNVTPVEEDSIHGSNIIAKSITAEKVSVKDLVAFGATIGGFNITQNAIYSVVKNDVGNTIRGIYLDNDGQIAFGDSNNYVKFFKDTDGTYKLIISTGGKTIDESMDDKIDNLQIGSRNLIRNSTSLIFEDYYFNDCAVIGTALLGTMILGKEK